MNFAKAAASSFILAAGLTAMIPVVGGTSGGLLVGKARAADIMAESLKDMPFSHAPTQDWSGFFIGGGVGGGIVNYSGSAAGTFDAATASPASTTAFAFPFDNDEGAFFGTAQLGYDRQLGSTFLVGLFADYDLNADMETSFSGTVDVTASGAAGNLSVAGTAEVDNSWTLGARLGFLLRPQTLVYGLAAWTHTNLDVSGTYSTDIGGGTPVAFRSEEELNALTVGAGIETMLRPGVSLKFEYRYTDLDGLAVVSDLALAAGVNSGGTGTVRADADLHTVRAVLTWRPNF